MSNLTVSVAPVSDDDLATMLYEDVQARIQWNIAAVTTLLQAPTSQYTLLKISAYQHEIYRLQQKVARDFQVVMATLMSGTEVTR